MGRLGLAFKCFFSVLAGNPVPEEALPEQEAPKALPAPEPPKIEKEDESKRVAAAIQMLSLLQNEGRLLDFLMEDIGAYSDDQIGAAVRNIHKDCRAVLEERLGLSPVLDEEEEASVTVEEGFDPSRIRLMGNVTGQPPFSGVLRHHGWQATAVNIPKQPEGHDLTVIAPAEVELP